MFDSEKSIQIVCSKGFSQRLEEDRISQLPDPLICHILSHLPTKDAVTTSVLSTRWRSLWLWVPSLVLSSRDFSDFNAFASFGDRFFDSDRVSCLDKLELAVNGNEDTSYIISWIEAAVKRKVQQFHLRVKFFSKYGYCGMPVSLYACETLVSLKLVFVTLDDVEFVSFPRLKTMHLSYVWLSKDAGFERFISCCPVLEDLEISGCANAPQTLRVYSRSLKRLYIGYGYSTQVDSVPGVVIDAPQLCFLSIRDFKSESFIIKNLKYNSKVVVDVTFGFKFSDEASLSSSVSSGITLIRSFLSGISKVGDLTIDWQTFQIIYNYSKSESLPQFGYMSRLCVSLFSQHLKGLATFLESCPNLKSLVVMLFDYLHYQELHPEEMNQIKCLQSSLEFVVFKLFTGDVAQMKLVRCFLENCVILKKLTLHLDSNSTTEDEIVKKLLEIPRASTKCEVVIVKN